MILQKYLKKKIYRKNKLILFLIFLYGITLTNLPTAYGTNFLNYSKNGFQEVSPTLKVGDGYASYDHMTTANTPLNTANMPITYSDMQNSINLSDSMSQTELSKELNVNVSSNGGWGEFSASASANFMNSISNSTYTENITYGERFYAVKSIDYSSLYGKNVLNPAGKQVYSIGIKAFTDRYGDNFIIGLPVGAIFLANVKLSFASEKTKQVFDATVGGSYGSIFSISTKVSNAIAQSNIQGSITVSAYQEGGDPAQLANIFTKSSSGGYDAVTCDFNNLSNCKAIITGIIDYAKNNFTKQIEQPLHAGNAPEGNLAVVGGPITRTYSSVFGLQNATPPSSDVLKERQRLAITYLQQEADKNIVEHLLDSDETLNKNELGRLDEDVKSNLALFNTYNVIACYKPGEESACIGIYDKVMTNFKSDVDSGVKKFKTAYTISCNKDMRSPIATNIYSGYANQYFSSSSTQSKLSMSGNITFSKDNTLLGYNGKIKGVSPDPVIGNFSLNGNLYEGKMSNFPCNDMTYIATVDNPL